MLIEGLNKKVRTEYMRFSLGRILLQHLIKWSIDKNLKELDFTIGDEPYKKIGIIIKIHFSVM